MHSYALMNCTNKNWMKESNSTSRLLCCQPQLGLAISVQARPFRHVVELGQAGLDNTIGLCFIPWAMASHVEPSHAWFQAQGLCSNVSTSNNCLRIASNFQVYHNQAMRFLENTALLHYHCTHQCNSIDEEVSFLIEFVFLVILFFLNHNFN